MRKAVISGTCRGANLPYFEVCGKTGTAQNRGHDHSAFMGFAPMNDPQIAVAVYVEMVVSVMSTVYPSVRSSWNSISTENFRKIHKKSRTFPEYAHQIR